MGVKRSFSENDRISSALIAVCASDLGGGSSQQQRDLVFERKPIKTNVLFL